MARKYEHLRALQKELNELLPITGTFLENELCRKITNVLITYEEYKQTDKGLDYGKYLIQREEKKRLFEESLSEARALMLHVEKISAKPL